MSNYARFFEHRTRDDGSAFYTLSDDRPEWLYDAVQEAHDGELPNDWRYDTAHSIVNLIDIGLSVPGEASEIADSLTDVYNYDLLEWVSGHLGRMEYVDEAISEGADTLTEALMRGQFTAIERMASILLEAIAENGDES